MSTAEELLTMTTDSTDEFLTIDLNTRLITIPASIKILGVESDDDVKRLQFKVPRYCGEFDLSKFDIRVNFENAKGKGDFYPVDELTYSDDSDEMTFSWLVDRFAFNYSGDVKFNVCMKLYDDEGNVIKELNTTLAALPVLEGLETEKAIVAQNPSAFDVVLNRLYAVEAANALGREGYYNIVTMEDTGTDVIFTLVDRDGNTTATVKDGYTPVKGVDYYTDAEEAEFKADLKEYVNTWSPFPITVTLYASRWSNNLQTVTAAGVTTSSIVIVSPDSSSDDNYNLYNEQGVRCIAQTTGSLWFVCDSPPSSDITVNVAVYYSSTSIGNTSTDVNAIVKRITPRNLLDNSDFTNPVNQRGQTYYSLGAWGGYTIDRWCAAGQGVQVDIRDNGVAIIGDLVQFMSNEASAPYASKPLTLAAKIDGQIYCGVGAIIIDGEWHRVAYIDIPGGFMSLDIDTDGRINIFFHTEYAIVEWVALYGGEYTVDILPEYQPKGYGAELAECQRYFIRMGGTDYIALCMGQAYSDSVVMAVLSLPVTMRVTRPSVTYSGTITVRSGASYADAVSIYPDSGGYGNTALLINTEDGSLTAGQACDIFTHPSSYIDLSADL